MSSMSSSDVSRNDNNLVMSCVKEEVLAPDSYIDLEQDTETDRKPSDFTSSVCNVIHIIPDNSMGIKTMSAPSEHAGDHLGTESQLHDGVKCEDDEFSTELDDSHMENELGIKHEEDQTWEVNTDGETSSDFIKQEVNDYADYWHNQDTKFSPSNCDDPLYRPNISSQTPTISSETPTICSDTPTISSKSFVKSDTSSADTCDSDTSSDGEEDISVGFESDDQSPSTNHSSIKCDPPQSGSGHSTHHRAVCDGKSSQSNDLTQMSTSHDAGKQKSCGVCGITWANGVHCPKHRNILSELKPHSCVICGKSFKLWENLKQHAQSHELKKPPITHPCTLCDRRFRQASHLATHMQIHIKSDRQHVCALCEKSYIHRADLTRHMYTHSEQTRHTCKSCGKRFTRASTLQQHMKIHVDFVCVICNETFTGTHYLNEHMKIHLVKKPHTCTSCEKCFLYTSQLKQHMKIHSREISYSCTLCGMSFVRQDDMKKHFIACSSNLV